MQISHLYRVYFLWKRAPSDCFSLQPVAIIKFLRPIIENSGICIYQNILILYRIWRPSFETKKSRLLEW